MKPGIHVCVPLMSLWFLIKGWDFLTWNTSYRALSSWLCRTLWKARCEVDTGNRDIGDQWLVTKGANLIKQNDHLPMQLLGLLAHVDDIVLAKHLWRVCLVPTRTTEGLAWNSHPLVAAAFQKDSDNTLFNSEEDWQKMVESLRLRSSTQTHSSNLL